MLFKTTAEIKTLLPVVGTTSFTRLKIFIKQAERSFIIPYISQGQYDLLDAAYNEGGSGTMEAELSNLLAKVQAALAQYFFFLWIPSAQLIIGDDGIHIASTENMKTAFPWQIEDLKRSTLKQAGVEMDGLLAFMHKNKSDYQAWVESSAYTEFKDCFISTTERFTELFSPIGNSRVNFMAIRSAMKKAQEFVIQAELGKIYYDHLKTVYQEQGSGAPEEKDVIIIDYVQKALAPLTMMRAFTELSVSIDELGILNFNNLNTGAISSQQKIPAKDSMISKLEQTAASDAKAYLQLMRDYLNDNIEDYEMYAENSSYNSETTDTSFQNDPDNNYFGMI